MPFLSVSDNVACTLFFADMEKALAEKHKHPSGWPSYARFDLFALWQPGHFDENTVLDLRTSEKFNSSFCAVKSSCKHDWMRDKGGDFAHCESLCGRLKEMLIGVRGDWWPDFSVLVDEGDRVLLNQVGGYQGTCFGDALHQMYSQPSALSQLRPTPERSLVPVQAARSQAQVTGAD